MSDNNIEVRIEVDTGDFQTALAEVVGCLADTVKEMHNNFAGLAAGIRASMDSAADSTGQAARKISDEMKNSAAQTVQAMNQLSQSIQKLKTDVGDKTMFQSMVEGMQEAMRSAIATTLATAALSAILKALVLAMNISPHILAITAGMAALAGAVYLVYSNWDEFKNWCIGYWNEIVDIISNNIDTIMTMLPGLAIAIYIVYEYWDDAVQLVMGIWDGLAIFVGAAVNAIKGFIGSIAETWPKFIDAAEKGISGFASALASLAGAFIPDWAKSIWNQIVGLGNSLADKTKEIGHAIRRNFSISPDEPSVADFRKGEYENTGDSASKKLELPKFKPVSWEGTSMPQVRQIGGMGSHGKEQSEYETAKKLYDQQLRLAEYTAAEKEALYKKYLENVQKSEQEAMSYKIGLYSLEKVAFGDMLKGQEIELKNAKAQGQITEYQYVNELAAFKQKSLDAETTFRAKAMMEAERLTEAEKLAQIEAYKEKVEATVWYKQALAEVLNAEKTQADYQKNMEKGLAEFRKQLDLEVINSQEKRLELLRSQESITQEQLIQAKKDMEDRRYAIEKAALEKSLEENAKNIDGMKKSYEKYVSTKDSATREMVAREMILNGLSADKVREILEQLEKLYGRYTKNQLDLDNDLRKERIKNLEQIRDSMKDSMSEAFQGVLTKSMYFLEALKNVFSSTMKNILKQLTDTMAKAITDKGFGNFLKKNDKDNKKGKDNSKDVSKKIRDQTGVIVAEQAKQAQLTAITGQGNAERSAMKAASDQQEVAMTSAMTTAEANLHTTADQTISASAQTASQTAVQSIQASLQAMIAMLPTLLIMSALSGLFGGGKTKTTESTGPGINLGRNPDSYYQTPALAGIPSFDVGVWRLPVDTLAMVHKNEMIVPTKGGLADGMRNMLANGGTQNSSPIVNLSYSAAHYGRTNRDVQGEMKQNAKFLVKTLNSEYRNFNRGKM